jgi:hypothetical protein
MGTRDPDPRHRGEGNMPQIRLDLDEVEEGLPEVCMRCGAPATVFKDKVFAWTPQWIGLTAPVLPLCIVLAIVLRKRVKVSVPLCRRHQNHWAWRIWFILASAGVLGLACAAGIGLLVALHPDDNDPVFALVCLGGAGLFLAWVITAAILQSTTIRPLDITDYGISLAGVSQPFIRAVYDRRDDDDEDEEDDEDDEPEPRRRPARPDRVYDPQTRRRRPPPNSYRAKGG